MIDRNPGFDALKEDVLTWLSGTDKPAEPSSSGANTIGDTKLVRSHLVDTARAGRPLTYSALLEGLGHKFSRPKMRALCKTLDAIDRDRAKGEPELAVLVVRQSDGLPGQGWWIGTAERYGYDGEWEGRAAARFVEGLQAAVFAYWRKR